MQDSSGEKYGSYDSLLIARESDDLRQAERRAIMEALLTGKDIAIRIPSQGDMVLPMPHKDAVRAHPRMMQDSVERLVNSDDKETAGTYRKAVADRLNQWKAEMVELFAFQIELMHRKGLTQPPEPERLKATFESAINEKIMLILNTVDEIAELAWYYTEQLYMAPLKPHKKQRVE